MNSFLTKHLALNGNARNEWKTAIIASFIFRMMDTMTLPIGIYLNIVI